MEWVDGRRMLGKSPSREDPASRILLYHSVHGDPLQTTKAWGQQLSWFSGKPPKSDWTRLMSPESRFHRVGQCLRFKWETSLKTQVED